MEVGSGVSGEILARDITGNVRLGGVIDRLEADDIGGCQNQRLVVLDYIGELVIDSVLSQPGQWYNIEIHSGGTVTILEDANGLALNAEIETPADIDVFEVLGTLYGIQASGLTEVLLESPSRVFIGSLQGQAEWEATVLLNSLPIGSRLDIAGASERGQILIMNPLGLQGSIYVSSQAALCYGAIDDACWNASNVQVGNQQFPFVGYTVDPATFGGGILAKVPSQPSGWGSPSLISW